MERVEEYEKILGLYCNFEEDHNCFNGEKEFFKICFTWLFE